MSRTDQAPPELSCLDHLVDGWLPISAIPKTPGGQFEAMHELEPIGRRGKPAILNVQADGNFVVNSGFIINRNGANFLTLFPTHFRAIRRADA